jgi:hypothetical protein
VPQWLKVLLKDLSMNLRVSNAKFAALTQEVFELKKVLKLREKQRDEAKKEFETLSAEVLAAKKSS